MNKSATRDRSNYLLRVFGITEGDYNFLFKQQCGKCAVCGKSASNFKYRLSIDHDHFTGEIRGLLCVPCNRYVIGRNRKGLNFLKSAYEYLEVRKYTGWFVPPKKKKRKKRRCAGKKKKNTIHSGVGSS